MPHVETFAETSSRGNVAKLHIYFVCDLVVNLEFGIHAVR